MNIEKELTKAFNELDTVAFDVLVSDIELPCNISSSEKITKRIYSKERRTMNRSVKKKSTALIIALAAAMTLCITAGAYVFNHKMSIGSFFGEQTASELENRGLISGQVVNGKHFDISIDTVLSNGRNFCIVATAAPKDDYGRSFASDSSAAGRVELAPSESADKLIKGISASTGVENGMIVMTFTSELCEYSENVTLPMQLLINSQADRQKGLVDAEFELKIEKNFDAVHFISSEGEQLELWDFGLHITNVQLDGRAANDSTVFSFMEHIELEFSDGSRTVLDNSANPEASILDISSISVNGTYDHNIEGSATFGHLIDSDKVTAVTICGKRFSAHKAVQ